MGKKDTAAIEFLEDRERFADVFNFLLYHGSPVIDPRQLHELDPRERVILYGKTGSSTSRQRYRDLLRYVAAMEDGQAAYLLLGIEHQSEIHYAMPVRNALYDALQYTRQIKRQAEERRKAGKENGSITSGEFLSGFSRDDRLIPVITLVVSFSSQKWDGPMCLHDMFLPQKDPILSFVPDYRINLLSAPDLSDEELSLLQTDLREVLLFIKHSERKDELQRIVQDRERFRDISREALQVINIVTGNHFPTEKKEGNINMCQAMKELLSDAQADGLAQGKKEGIRVGLAQGKKEGIRVGLAQGKSEGIRVGLAQGKSEGIRVGLNEGIRGAVAICREMGMLPSVIAEKITEQFHLSLEEAQQFVQ